MRRCNCGFIAWNLRGDRHSDRVGGTRALRRRPMGDHLVAAAQIAMMDFQAARYLVDGEVPPQAGNDHPYVTPTGAFEPPTVSSTSRWAAKSNGRFLQVCSGSPTSRSIPTTRPRTARYQPSPRTHRDHCEGVQEKIVEGMAGGSRRQAFRPVRSITWMKCSTIRRSSTSEWRCRCTIRARRYPHGRPSR